MKRLLYLFSLVVFLAQPVTSQNPNNKITVQKSFGAVNFYMEGERLTFRQLIRITTPCETACAEIKSSQRLYTTGIISAGVGGFIIGWQAGNAIDGHSPKWGMVALGGGIALVSIPLTKHSMKKAVNAIDLYNASLKQISFRQINKPEFSLSFNGNGLGLKLNF
jgi:hypothetical protein